MLAVFPEGFEEADRGERLELAAYTDARGEERARAEFGDVVLSEVPSDWEERWKRFHRPAIVAGLWVGPPWETPPPSGAAVVIDPGRAFGTGSHQTTRLCVELLAELPRTSLLDVEADGLPAAETSVANINERLVARVAARANCATLVTSGYFEPHVPAVPGYRRVQRRTADGWAADVYARE